MGDRSRREPCDVTFHSLGPTVKKMLQQPGGSCSLDHGGGP